MTPTEPSPVTRWRKRRRRQGFVRVEIQVRKEDAPLVREIATARANDLTLVTRNVADLAGLDVKLLNPFDP